MTGWLALAPPSFLDERCTEQQSHAEPFLPSSPPHPQILSNLLSNAVKFTSQGEVVVEAWAETTPPAAVLDAEGSHAARGAGASVERDDDRGADVPGRPRLHVTVRDTGIGISEASMARLFQQFRQGHESMSRRYGGTGARPLPSLAHRPVLLTLALGPGQSLHCLGCPRALPAGPSLSMFAPLSA